MKAEIALILLRMIAVISVNASALLSSVALAKWLGLAPAGAPAEWVLVTYIAASAASIVTFHILRD